MTPLWQWVHSKKPRWDNSILENVVDRAIVFGALAMAVCSFSLFMVIGTIEEPRVPVGTVVESRGAQRRSSRELGWSSLSTGATVFQGDAVKTEGAGKVVVRLNNGKQWEIPNRTLVTLDDLDADELAVTFYQGKMTPAPGIVSKEDRVLVAPRRTPSPILAAPLLFNPEE